MNYMTPVPTGYDKIPSKPVLRIANDSCMAGRPIKNALVRRQYWIGLCPKMKDHPLCNGFWNIKNIRPFTNGCFLYVN